MGFFTDLNFPKIVFFFYLFISVFDNINTLIFVQSSSTNISTIATPKITNGYFLGFDSYKYNESTSDYQKCPCRMKGKCADISECSALMIGLIGIFVVSVFVVCFCFCVICCLVNKHIRKKACKFIKK